MLMLQEIKKHLQRIIDDIDTGNSYLEKEDLELLSDTLIRMGENKLSKYQAKNYLHVERSKFDQLVRVGKIPKGKKQQGFTELFWYKSDLDKYLKSKDKD